MLALGTVSLQQSNFAHGKAQHPRVKQFAEFEIGDANRSARVERPFHFIENNFLAGRTFVDWQDLNNQARQWCDRVNATYKKHIRAVPRELYAAERPLLKPRRSRRG